MSSDYLNYELSAELHRLGVVFEEPSKAYYGYDIDVMKYDSDLSPWVDQEPTIKLHDYTKEYYEMAGICVSPSTAQVLDKLREFGDEGFLSWQHLTHDAERLPNYNIHSYSKNISVGNN